MATQMTAEPFGVQLGSILGGLAGGTAVTTNQWYVQPLAQTNCVQCGYQPAMQWTTITPAITAQQWVGYGTANQGYQYTAQWIGQQVGFRQIVAQLITPTIWTPQYTPEQMKAMEIAEEKRRIEREAAKARATELLSRTLDKGQLEQFKAEGHFDVKIKDRTYRITPGRKVHALHEPKYRRALCIMPSGYLPDADVALAQKLLLETDEEKFLKTAIRWAA